MNSVDLGAQGGNSPEGTVLDLSSCVNPYGPAPAALKALSDLDVGSIKLQPHHAVARLEEAYSQRLGAPTSQLVAARGASEPIWQLADIFRDKQIALPLPTYTEYLKAFTHAVGVRGSELFHTVEQLKQAGEQAGVVVFSNPHNPTGMWMDNAELEEVFMTHPNVTFVIDESYADFDAKADFSAIGTDAENVVVLRSPTKFFGIGGVRVGIIWTRNQMIRDELLRRRTTYPISEIEVAVAVAAFADDHWQQDVRNWMSDDVKWLDGWLSQFSDIDVVQGRLHFRLVTGDTSKILGNLATNGLHVRVLTTAHGVPEGSFRISAPSSQDRHLLGLVSQPEGTLDVWPTLDIS